MKFEWTEWDRHSLRDEFAMAALTGILAYPGDAYSGSAHNNSTPEGVAREAYRYADAMLKARKFGEDEGEE